MSGVIDSIKQILPDTPAGDGWDEDEWDEDVGKAQVIRTWIRSVLRKIVHYQAEHDRLLNEAAATLQLALPHDIAMCNILPFLELPSHEIKVEDLEEDDSDSSDDDTEVSDSDHKEKGASRYFLYSFVGLLLVVFFTFVKGMSFPSLSVNGWKNGYGKYTLANGNFYEGEFQDNKKHGYGKYAWANGDVYDGEYQNDMRNGKGKLTRANGNVYDGEYKDNKRHGHGKFTWADGSVYEGEFQDGNIQSYGKHTWANGSVYEGEFQDGEIHSTLSFFVFKRQGALPVRHINMLLWVDM